MDPDTIVDNTLREGIFEYDPELEEIYEDNEYFVNIFE